MPTTKKRIEEIAGKKEISNVFELRESLGALSDIVVTDKGELKRLVESAYGLKYPDRVKELLDQPNIAVLRIIKAGWSINGNYYDIQVLRELVDWITHIGHIQFKNHIIGTALDRNVDELVSYSKYVWFDESTKAVYSAVKFPREKVDTVWIFNLIQDDPEIVGVSISAAVQIQEDFEFEGAKGDKIISWVWFDSADYILFPSAGGQAIEASIMEKITLAQEKTKSLKNTLKLAREKVDIKGDLEKVEVLVEQMTSFFTRYYRNEVFSQVDVVLTTLNSFLYDCIWEITKDNKGDVVGSIEKAFDSALDKLKELEFWKNPNAHYDSDGKLIKKESILNNRSNTMFKNLKELRHEHPDICMELEKEALQDAEKSLKEKHQAELAEAEKKLKEKETAYDDLKKKHDDVSRLYDEKLVAEKIVTKKQKIQELLTESKIAKELITERFVKDLESCEKEEDMKAVIEDRKKIIELASKNSTTTHVEGSPEGDKTVDESLVKKVAQEISR